MATSSPTPRRQKQKRSKDVRSKTRRPGTKNATGRPICLGSCRQEDVWLCVRTRIPSRPEQRENGLRSLFHLSCASRLHHRLTSGLRGENQSRGRSHQGLDMRSGAVSSTEGRRNPPPTSEVAFGRNQSERSIPCPLRLGNLLHQLHRRCRRETPYHQLYTE